MRIVFMGLSLSSSWGNGHATTYRSLLKGLSACGHDATFLERDKPWYAANRDLRDPDYCDLRFYESPGALDRHRDLVARADAVIIGSYVPDGSVVTEWASRYRRGLLAFYDIDTPVTLQNLAKGDCEYLDARCIPVFDLYLSFTGGPILQVLQDVYRAKRAVPMYCSVDPSLYHPVEAPKRWDLGYLGTYSADRQPALERSLLEPARRLPERRFVVAGPQYPSDIAWPSNVDRIEHLPPPEHALFYSSMDWTLNVTRSDMVKTGYSPSVRLFEATACGVPVLSDPWTGIEDVLTPNRDVLIRDTAAGIVEALAMPDDVRNAIGQSGQQTTLRYHTGVRRATELTQQLQRLVSG